MNSNQVLFLGLGMEPPMETGSLKAGHSRPPCREQERLHCTHMASIPIADKWRITRYIRYALEFIDAAPLMEPACKLRNNARRVARGLTSMHQLLA